MNTPNDQLPEDCDRCPNNYSRRQNGLLLFGQRIDPLEIVIHVMILFLIGMPAVRTALNPETDWHQSAKWAFLLFGASTIARLSPTDRVNLYQKVRFGHHSEPRDH